MNVRENLMTLMFLHVHSHLQHFLPLFSLAVSSCQAQLTAELLLYLNKTWHIPECCIHATVFPNVCPFLPLTTSPVSPVSPHLHLATLSTAAGSHSIIYSSTQPLIPKLIQKHSP